MKVIVTGANGFIGLHVTAQLLNAGWEVHALTQNGTAPPDGTVGHPCDLHSRSYLNALRAIRATHMIHLAWSVRPGQFWHSPENIEWVSTSVRLAQDFAEAGGRRFIGSGSCAEYDWNGGGRLEETSQLRPSTLYGACKASVGLIIDPLLKQLGTESAWARVFYPYGPGEAAGRLIPDVIRAVLLGEPALCSEGRQIRDYVYVGDVAAAFVALLESKITGPVNIGTGEQHTVREMALTVGKLTGRPELIQLGARPTRPDEPAEITAGTERLGQLGLAAFLTPAEGLAKTIEWWRSRLT